MRRYCTAGTGCPRELLHSPVRLMTMTSVKRVATATAVCACVWVASCSTHSGGTSKAVATLSKAPPATSQAREGLRVVASTPYPAALYDPVKPLRAGEAMVLDPDRVAFEIGGSSCSPVAKTAALSRKTVVLDIGPSGPTCTSDLRMYVLVVTLNREVFTDIGGSGPDRLAVGYVWGHYQDLVLTPG